MNSILLARFISNLNKIHQKNINIGLVIILILLIFFRDPQLFFYPRFWGEEGVIYFSSALENGFQSLFLPQLGYYSFVPNLATFLATLVPLLYAPFVTLVFSFVITFIPLLIILFSKSIFWENSYTKKIIGIGIIIFINDAAGIWLNTVNSQFYLCLITFLILLEQDSEIGKTKQKVYLFLLIIAFFTGAVSCFLTPFFLLAFLKNKNSFNTKAMVVSLLITIIQLSIVVFEYIGIKTVSIAQDQRFYLDLELVDILVSKNYLGSFFVSQIANIIYINISQYYALPSLIFVFFSSFLLYVSRYLDQPKKILFLGSILIISFFSYVGSFEYYSIALEKHGIRYAFVPNIILNFLLLEYIWKNFSKESRKYLFIFLLFFYSPFFLKYFFHYRSNDYRWKEQVELYQKNKTKQIVVPPGFILKMNK